MTTKGKSRQPRKQKLRIKVEDYRLRNRNCGYLRCGGYARPDSDGYHTIHVVCRPCGKAWVERARKVWQGVVTNCGCMGSDEQTIRQWLYVTQSKYWRLRSALERYNKPIDPHQHLTILDIADLENERTADIDKALTNDYPDDWRFYWRFRRDVGLAPSSHHVLRKVSDVDSSNRDPLGELASELFGDPDNKQPEPWVAGKTQWVDALSLDADCDELKTYQQWVNSEFSTMVGSVMDSDTGDIADVGF